MDLLGGNIQYNLRNLSRSVIVFQRVLTAEYVDACKVDDVEDLKRRGLDVADVSLP